AELLELPLSVAPSLPLLPQSTLAAVSELVVGVTLRGLRRRVAALTLRGFGLGLAALAAGQFRDRFSEEPLRLGGVLSGRRGGVEVSGFRGRGFRRLGHRVLA